MSQSLRQALFRVRYPYPNAVDQQRASGLLWMSWALFFVNLIWLAGVIGRFILNNQPVELELWILSVFFIPVHILVVLAIQRGGYRVAAWGMSLTLLGIAVSQVNTLSSSAVLLLVMPIVFVGLLLDHRALLIITLLISANIVRVAYLQSQQLQPLTTIPAQNAPLSAAVVLVSMLVIMAFLYVFNNSIQLLARTSLDAIQHLRTIAAFQLSAESETDIALYSRALQLVTRQLGYSFAQIYTFDEYQRLYQQVRLGVQSGEAIVSGDVRLDPQSNIIASADRRATIVTTRADAAPARAHLLPGSTLSIAVPIMDDRRILGVLDVQSEASPNIQPNQLSTLETLADQLARLIMYNRRVQSLQADLRDQMSVVSRLRARMVTLLESEQSSANKAWLDYLQQQADGVMGYDMRPDNEKMIRSHDMPEALRSALADGEIVFEQTEEGRVLSIPVIFRGQILGAMSFTIPDGQPVTERHMDMARNVANRLAIALENKRLFEQSQAQALREAKANEAARELLTSTDVQTVVEIAAEHFNAALGAIQTRIYVGQPAALPAETKTQQEATP